MLASRLADPISGAFTVHLAGIVSMLSGDGCRGKGSFPCEFVRSQWNREGNSSVHVDRLWRDG